MNVPITYEEYAYDVSHGHIPACENIKLAVERYYWFKERDDMYFDKDRVDYTIKFIAKLKQFEGQFNNQPMILQPWQQFIVANVFGWKWKKNDLRVTRNVYILTPRKSGKTTFMAALALVGLLIDGENGAEIDFVANSRQQASLAFKHVKNFTESLDPEHQFLKVYKNGRIEVDITQSKIQVLASDAMKNDGYNSHFCIYDELHASKDSNLYDVMKTSMGARRQPLMLIISTAGFLLDGYPCFEMRKSNIEILKGLKEDDTQFSMIFELDEGDDWEDSSTWNKVQPSLNLTVSTDSMKEYVNKAKNNPAEMTNILTKIFNKFCTSKEVWIGTDIIYPLLQNVDLNRLKGERCFMGLDMASTNDFTAQSIMFPPNPDREYYPDKYIFKSFIYVPAGALEKSVNQSLYKQWKRDGQIEVTDSNVVQYDVILKKQMEFDEDFDIQGIYYDTYKAQGWAIQATELGLYLEPYPQTMGPFTKPTVNFGYLAKTGQVVIDNNSCVLWCFNNCELKYGGKQSDDMICKPVKAGGIKSNKIDPIISMLEALGGYMASPYYELPEIQT